jgi:hypothetical protein
MPAHDKSRQAREGDEWGVRRFFLISAAAVAGKLALDALAKSPSGVRKPSVPAAGRQ